MPAPAWGPGAADVGDAGREGERRRRGQRPKITLLIEDNQSTEDGAAKAASKLLSTENVDILLGASRTGPSLAMRPLAEQAKTPMISLAANQKIVDGSTWVFKTAQNDRVVLERIVDDMKAQGLKKVAVARDASGFGEGVPEMLARSASPPGSRWSTSRSSPRTPPTSRRRWSTSATPSLTPRSSGASPAASLAQVSYERLGPKVPVYQSHGIGNQVFLDTAKDSADGLRAALGRMLVADQLGADDPQKEVVTQFISDYKAKYNQNPSTFAGHAYDGFMIAIESLKKAGTDPNRLRDAIEQTSDWPGISGVFTMTPEDHSGLTKEALVMVTVDSGKWKVLEGARLMSDFLQLVFSGLALGAVYGLVALGFVAIFSVREIVNLVQGEYAALAGLSAISAVTAGVPLLLAVVLVVPLVVLVSVVIERLAIRPVHRMTPLVSIILTLGISTALKAVMLLVWGPEAHRLPEFPAGTSSSVGSASRPRSCGSSARRPWSGTPSCGSTSTPGQARRCGRVPNSPSPHGSWASRPTPRRWWRSPSRDWSEPSPGWSAARSTSARGTTASPSASRGSWRRPSEGSCPSGSRCSGPLPRRPREPGRRLRRHRLPRRGGVRRAPPRAAGSPAGPGPEGVGGQGLMARLRRFLPFIVLAVGLAVFPVVASTGVVNIGVYALIYGLAAIGLSLLMGLAGQVSLGHAAFFAVGAYAQAILVTKTGVHGAVSAVLAVLASMLLALLVGLPLLRLRGHFLALATLGLGIIVSVVVRELEVTGGTSGIFGIPKPDFNGRVYDSPVLLAPRAVRRHRAPPCPHPGPQPHRPRAGSRQRLRGGC